ncbi:hypothetical protein ACKKBF_B10190 [Auxenochlorella protothecoides x Auxenochlorella symbiontica]
MSVDQPWTSALSELVTTDFSTAETGERLAGLITSLKRDRVNLAVLNGALGPFLISENDANRGKALAVFAEALVGIPGLIATEADAHHTGDFFCARLNDRPSLHGALLGCLMFLENPACPPSLSQAQLLSVAKNLTSNVFVQHLPQTERLLAYRALQALVQDYGQQLLDAGVSLWDACLAGMDGERDPRGLLAAFALARSLMALYSAQPSNSLAAGQMEEGSEELFDILSCYFPISFSPPANDPHGITREGLARALADVLLCSPAFLPFLLPVLLEKLASSLRQAKTDALDLLRRVPGACSPADLDAHADWGEVWTRLRAEICLPEALEAPALGSAQDLATPAAQCLAEWVSQLSRVRHGQGSSLVQDAAVQQALQCLRDPGSTQAAQARASRLVQAGVHILSGVCSSVAACDELEDALGRITEAIKSPTAPLAAQALAWQGLAQMIKAGPRILTALLAPCQEWVQLAIRRHDVAEAQQASEVIAVSDADLWTLDWPCTASTVTLRSLCFLQRAVEVLGPSGLGPAAQEAALYLTLQAMDAAEPDLAASAMQTLLALARFGEESRALLAIVLRAALQGEGPGAWAPAGDALVRQLARASATACTMGIEAALARLRPDAEGATAMEAIGAEGSIDAGHVLAALNCLADLLTHPHDESGSEGVLAALLGAYKSGTDGEAEAAAQLVAAALPGASPAAQAAWAGRAKASLLATKSDPGVALVHCGVLIGCSRAAARAACSLPLVRRLSELWRTDGQRSLYIEAAASLVNKWPDDRPEGLVPALDVWMTSLAGKGSAPDAAWIEGRAALARALALRSHARAAAALEEGIAACCRPAAGVEDGPRFVRGVLAAAAQRSPSALVRPLWRQRTLTLLVSALLRALGPPPPFVPALCTLGAALTSVDPALQRSQLARVETLLAPCLAAVADLPGQEQTVTGLLDMLAGLAGSGATTADRDVITRLLPDAFPALLRCAAHREPDVRRAALSTLCALAALPYTTLHPLRARARAAARAALDDDARSVRGAAAHCMLAWGE